MLLNIITDFRRSSPGILEYLPSLGLGDACRDDLLDLGSSLGPFTFETLARTEAELTGDGRIGELRRLVSGVELTLMLVGDAGESGHCEADVTNTSGVVGSVLLRISESGLGSPDEELLVP